jgi:hypothetical protein
MENCGGLKSVGEGIYIPYYENTFRKFVTYVCMCLQLFAVYDLHVSTIKILIVVTVLLPVVLYGHETWSPTVREENRPRVFKNRVLRRIFESKRDEIIRDW